MRLNRDKSDFSQGSVTKTILRISLPMMVAELVNVFYSLVDRMYIGHIDEVGTQCLTGIGLTMPLIMFISAFSQMCSTGGAPLASIARGEGNNEKAGRIQNTSFTMLLVFGAILTAVFALFSDRLLLLIGADAETLPYAMDYFSIYILGTVFSIVSLGMNPFINAQGASGIGMFTVLIGAVLNLILDPLFIFTFGMGVKGAAIATVISQIASAAWVLIFLTGKKAALPLTKLELKPRTVLDICKLGVTGFTFRVTNSLTSMVTNVTLKTWGGENAVLYIGAMSVINSLREVVHQPVFALTRGAQPIQSFNYGAGLYGRVLKAFRFETFAALAYNTLMFLLIEIFAEPIVRVFTQDPELISVAVHCTRIFFMFFIFMSFQQAAQNSFVALNRPKLALFFSLFRKIILLLPLTLLLPRMGLGVDGPFYAEAISEIVGSVCSFTVFLLTVGRELKQLIRKQKDSIAGQEV